MSPWIDDAAQRPWRHGFVPLMRRLAAQAPSMPPIGKAQRPQQESFRLGQQASLAFAPRELFKVEVRPGADQRPRAHIKLFGLGTLGPNGALPIHCTELVRERVAPQSEVQYGSFSSRPEAPDWAEVERDARRLLLRSKDIGVLVWFTRARCRLAGAAGLLEGLLTLQAMLQAYPEQVHPQVVLDGVPDPAVRANALAALCDPDGLLGDVRDVVVSAGTAFRLTVRDVERAFAVPRPPYAPEPEGVKRQLADLHVKGDGALRALLACGNAVLGIDHWSQGAFGDDAPHLGPLMHLLGGLAAFAAAPSRGEKLQIEEVEAGAGRQGPPPGSAVAPPVDLGDVRGVGPPALPAAVATHAHIAQEREQIRALLRQIRHWVEHHEPSSPVTILLKQADRMWGRRFAEVAHMIPPDLMQAWDRDD